MKNRSLYVSDLDGTLLRDDATLSDYSREALNQFYQQNVLFTIASARSVVSMRSILEGVRLRLPVIEFNGAFISDLASGNHLVVNSIDPEGRAELYQLITGLGFPLFISTYDGVSDQLYYRDVKNEGMSWYLRDRQKNRDSRLRHIDDLYLTLTEDVVCFTIIDTYDNLVRLKPSVERLMGDRVEIHFTENQYSPGWHWLTIHDARATKDKAIQTLVRDYDLEGVNLVVFGNDTNDIKMLQAADEAIAVSNAVRALKDHATRMIDSNNQDSVVRFIQNRLNKT